MSNAETYAALVELKNRVLPFEVEESVVEELNAILDEAGESGLGFKIPLEDLPEQTYPLTSTPGNEKRTGKLIIDRPDFLRKVDAAVESFKPKKSGIGFR